MGHPHQPVQESAHEDIKHRVGQKDTVVTPPGQVGGIHHFQEGVGAGHRTELTPQGRRRVSKVTSSLLHVGSQELLASGAAKWLHFDKLVG